MTSYGIVAFVMTYTVVYLMCTDKLRKSVEARIKLPAMFGDADFWVYFFKLMGVRLVFVTPLLAPMLFIDEPMQYLGSLLIGNAIREIFIQLMD
jgi:hypothetical protein